MRSESPKASRRPQEASYGLSRRRVAPGAVPNRHLTPQLSGAVS